MKYAAFIFSALAAHVASITFEVSGTSNGEPVPLSELTLTEFNRPPELLRNVAVTNNGGRIKAGIKTAAAAAANPILMSTNWCGSVNRVTAVSRRIKSITGSWQHPDCRPRTDKTFPQIMASLVSISDSNSLLQAGSHCEVKNATSKSTNFAWFQWVPQAAAQHLDNFPVTPGDWLQITIFMLSTTNARVTIANQSKGMQRSIAAFNGSALIGVEPAWIVQTPVINGGKSWFPQYDGMWMTEASCTLNDNTNLGIMGSTQWQVEGQCKSIEFNNTVVEMDQYDA